MIRRALHWLRKAMGSLPFFGCALIGIACVWWAFPPQPRLRLKADVNFGTFEISKDGRAFAGIHEDGAIVWDPASGTVLRTIDESFFGHVRAGIKQFHLSPDGEKALYLQRNNRWALLDLRNGSDPVHLGTDGQNLQPLGFFRENQAILADVDLACKPFDVQTGAILADPPVEFQNGSIYWLVVLANKREFLMEANSGPHNEQFLNVWDLTARRKCLGAKDAIVPSILEYRSRFPVVFSPQGSLVAFRKGNRLFAHRTSDGSEVASLPLPLLDPARMRLEEPDFVPKMLMDLASDGRLLLILYEVVPSFGCFLHHQVWDVSTSSPRLIESKEIEPQHSAYLSPDGKWLTPWKQVPGAVAGFIEVVRTDTLEAVATLPNATDVHFSPDSRMIASHQAREQSWWQEKLGRFDPLEAHDGAVWEVPSGKLLTTLTLGDKFAWLPDSKAIVILHGKNEFQIWDIPPRRPRWVEYGLPALFVSVLLLGVYRWRHVRRLAA